ncbi:hypothetical protein DLM78_04975 [Leptospira stimsonii]|uniref:Uncharacterized protein n=1 Tax=Leptospira stimsonii TaxID=2202203 RepID=A0A8B3CZ42_9LEPT|nr:hypothetical protein DLM78_04975 [Leptospira stimsonii]
MNSYNDKIGIRDVAFQEGILFLKKSQPLKEFNKTKVEFRFFGFFFWIGISLYSGRMRELPFF